jgi:hypothetical protein
LRQLPRRAHGELLISQGPIRKPALGVHPGVWAALAGREIESVFAAIRAVGANRDARAQARRLVVAALRDVGRFGWEEIADALEVRETDPPRSLQRDAAIGRRVWSELRAWPYAVPSGPLPNLWERDPEVCLAWELWRRDVGQTTPPVAGWLDIGLGSSADSAA